MEILEIARTNRTAHNVEMLAQGLDADTEGDASAKGEGPQGTLVAMGKAFTSVPFLTTFASFSYLCFLGQLLTFGMSYFWPQLLGSPVFEIAYMNPATTLGLIRSFGIPSALLMIPIMLSQVGHRWIIGVSGVIEALVLFGCIIVLRKMAEALVPLACLSLGSANLFYACVVLFMTESYPTSVRAVMSALSISLGRVGAIGGPSMVELFGFKGFLQLTAVLAFSALPLLVFLVETKGKQLEDFLLEKEEERAPLVSTSEEEERDREEETHLGVTPCRPRNPPATATQTGRGTCRL